MILAFETGYVAPNLHFETPKAEIPGLKNGNLKVVTEKTEFQGQYYGVVKMLAFRLKVVVLICVLFYVSL